MEIEIRSIRPTDSLEELTRILNASYKQLADLGFQYVASHQDVATTKERIEKGRCFLALLGGKMIGTICYYPKESSNGSNWYAKEGVAGFGQFGVDPKYQQKGIGNQLVSFVESQAIEDKAEELALDTAEGAHHLINWYKRLGYRFVEYANWDVTNYRSVIMSKKLPKNA